MIYEYPQVSEDIRQGDIFVGLPRIDLSLRELIVVGGTGVDAGQSTWEDVLARTHDVITVAVAARQVSAIVITQDCDTLRAPQIALCEIRPLNEMVTDLGASLKSFVSNLLKQTRYNLKWFYLPIDDQIGFTERKAVDFRVTISVEREDLESLKTLRRGRLNPEADEHFRERLGEFFRRYPVDEWYPFTREEFAEYQRKYPGAKPRPWQQALSAPPDSPAER